MKKGYLLIISEVNKTTGFYTQTDYLHAEQRELLELIVEERRKELEKKYGGFIFEDEVCVTFIDINNKGKGQVTVHFDIIDLGLVKEVNAEGAFYQINIFERKANHKIKDYIKENSGCSFLKINEAEKEMIKVSEDIQSILGRRNIKEIKETSDIIAIKVKNGGEIKIKLKFRVREVF